MALAGLIDYATLFLTLILPKSVGRPTLDQLLSLKKYLCSPKMTQKVKV